MAERAKWLEDQIRAGKLPNYKSASGIELKEFYTADDAPRMDEVPGEYPFTRGIHRTMYRTRIPTSRQQTGFDTVEETNKRMKFLLEQGNTGLAIDGDMPTKYGLDPDNPLAYGDVGLVGGSITTLEDMERLFQDIPLNKVSTTLIFPPPSSIVMMAMYVLVARKQGIRESELIGTMMNCYFSQMSGGAYESTTRFFPIDPAVELGIDVAEYCIRNIPKWNTYNVNTYNIRECGINAKQEAAFGLSLATDYIKKLIERGLDVDDFAGRFGFFVSLDNHILEEISKVRAMRRIWAKIMKERFGAKSPSSWLFRSATHTSGKALTAQQPLNNIARIAIGTLAGFLAGLQSLDMPAYDEAYALPTEEAHKTTIRIQQIIAYETDVCKTVDPLGGSYVIEALTNQLEDEIQSLMKLIEDMGGYIECFKKGWIEEQMDQAKHEWARKIEDREEAVIGLNVFREEKEAPIDVFGHSSDVPEQRKEYTINYKKNRNQVKVSKALETLYKAATSRPRANLFVPVLEAVQSKATTGEIIDTLRKAQNFTYTL